jgi:hypothetical protein|tara:strand:+ start:814 stop:2007 length:1194 start_codon:yes stop_codon:yes gene_type:complete
MFLSEEIKDKWQPVMEHEDLPKIQDATKRAITLRLLENQEIALQEANVTGANVDNWDPILISLVRRTMPQLMAYDTIGVQPMSGPTGLIFAMKSHYTGEASTGAEALTLPAGQPDVDFSGDDANTQNTYTTAEGEALGGFVSGGGAFKEMSFSIEKSSVTAETRALKAKYSLELAQDLKAIHGLDAESELSNILSAEILAEINREVIEKILSQATPGATAGTTTAGTFDVSDPLDNRGARWGGERYKSLLIQINREANLIAKNTGRGAGNWLLVSPDVASALDMVAGLAVPNMEVGSNQPDIANNIFAGTLGNKYKVYIDQFAAADSVTVGYKGANMYDAGLFYCPYVPLQLMKSIGEEDFQPRLGFKTRYGLTHNPFASGTAAQNPYFRKFTVTNL